MAVVPKQIGPYEITREIGRGGMGVVYLARDERLDRDVAIKALPVELADDPVRLERFEREAKTLAQLNHPNVAGIHGVEEQDGQRFLILEYVEGETLGERLDHGPIPVDEAIEIAIEIAKGVEAAHEASVIHRDLKPDNIKITPDGHVKVLDFGLAKAEESSTSTVQGDSPTVMSRHSPTIPGAILGTAAYMSPEQARGRKVDKRTDTWSFGVVLYEMLTGASPFAGESASDSIGAVLHKNIELDRLPASTPRGVGRILSRCLERDRDFRSRDIGDVRIELDRAMSESTEPSDQRKSTPRSLALAAAAGWIIVTGGVLSIVTGVWNTGEPLVALTPVHSSILAPDGYTIESFAISPDGAQVSMIVVPGEIGLVPGPRRSLLYVRELASGQVKPVAGSDGAFTHRYSPDGSAIAFVTRGKESSDEERVMRLPADLSADPIEVLTVPSEFTVGSNGWFCFSPVGAIVFLDSNTRTIGMFDATTGRELRRLQLQTSISSPRLEALGRPFGDRHVTIQVTRYTEEGFQFDMGLVDLETGQLDLVVENAVDLRKVSDAHVIFTRSDSIFLSPFDAESRSLTGSYRPVQRGLGTGSTWSHGSYALSDSGTLAYLAGGVQGQSRQLVILERNGDARPWFDERRRFEEDASISLDGSKLVCLIAGPGGLYELWTSETERPRLRRLHAEPGGDTFKPIFTPDGEHIIAAQWTPRAEEPGKILMIRFDGTEEPRRIWGGWSNGEWVYPTSVSHDGTRTLVALQADGRSRILELALNGESEPRLLVEASNIYTPRFPPADVPLVCYVSTETGRAEVFVRTVDEDRVGPAIPVTTRGAWVCDWLIDENLGLCIVHFDLEWKQHITPISIEDGRISIGESTPTGQAGDTTYSDRSYTRDGRSLTIQRGNDERHPTHLELVQNWLPPVHEEPKN